MTVALRARNTFQLFKKAFSEWNEDKAPTFAASLSYYTMFSIAPVLVIAVSVAGMVFGEEAARGHLARPTEAEKRRAELPAQPLPWLGAAVTSLLFSLGKLGIGLYLGRSTVSSSYGAAGSLAVVLIWVYYSAQILFLGAEFTQVYARNHGSRAQQPA